jgi:sodium/glucose cotransporter 9/sodium/myo-inositol cotransporter 11
MLIGHMSGIIRLGLDLAYPAPQCGEEDARPPVLANLHYTYFGALVIVITSLAIIIISLLTKPRTEEEVNQNYEWGIFLENETD